MSTATAKAKAENGNSKNAAMEVKKNDSKVENPVLTLEKRIQKEPHGVPARQRWAKFHHHAQRSRRARVQNQSQSGSFNRARYPAASPQ